MIYRFVDFVDLTGAWKYWLKVAVFTVPTRALGAAATPVERVRSTTFTRFGFVLSFGPLVSLIVFLRLVVRSPQSASCREEARFAWISTFWRGKTGIPSVPGIFKQHWSCAISFILKIWYPVLEWVDRLGDLLYRRLDHWDRTPLRAPSAESVQIFYTEL